jgi:hypothetical protein
MGENTERTMEELREYTGRRLRDAIHGREIDMMKPVRPHLPHMLGLCDIGEVVAPRVIDGSILDSRHEFWDDYYKEVNTRNKAKSEVISAIESLKADGLFRMSYPYGEDGEIIYVEVDDPDQYSIRCRQNNSITTHCKECNHTLRTSPDLVLYNNYYHLRFSVACDNCGFTGNYSRKFIQQ